MKQNILLQGMFMKIKILRQPMKIKIPKHLQYFHPNHCHQGHYQVPSSMNVIDKGALSGCQQITQLSLLNERETFIQQEALSSCFHLTQLNNSSVSLSIGAWAFSGCQKFTHIEGLQSIKALGEGAFSRCHSLVSAVLSDEIKVIEKDTFLGCYALKDLSMSKGVTRIESCAFANCQSLTRFMFPDRLNYIGEHAFFNCHRITKVDVNPKTVNRIDEEGQTLLSRVVASQAPHNMIKALIGAGAHVGREVLSATHDEDLKSKMKSWAGEQQQRLCCAETEPVRLMRINNYLYQSTITAAYQAFMATQLKQLSQVQTEKETWARWKSEGRSTALMAFKPK